MKGIIVVNPFGNPKESIFQAERLKEEFNKLSVDVQIVSDGYLNNCAGNKTLDCKYNNVDFAVFLDKDKYLSKSFELAGIRLFNKHDAIRVCDDKAETYLALVNSGVKIPKTYFAPVCYRSENKVDIDGLTKISNDLHYPVIVKESYGSMGSGVFKAENLSELVEVSEKLKLRPHLYQEYIPYRKGTDVRVIVIGKKVVCAMERVNENDFRSNIALGGTGRIIELSKEFKACAEKVATILNLDYCGVDLLYGKDDTPFVCEVNSNAFFKEIERVTNINVAKHYANYILEKLSK